MPLVTIELHAGSTTPDQRASISLAVHGAMREALAIPADDRFHVFHELPEGSMFHDPVAFGRPRSDRFMFVTLSFNERPAEQKQALYAALLRHLAPAGVHEDDVGFRIVETARENWWASGRVVNPDTGYDERMAT